MTIVLQNKFWDLTVEENFFSVGLSFNQMPTKLVIPFRAITHFAVETAGHFDMEAELKIWISGTADPIQRTFTRGQSILEVQKALASYVGR